MLKDLLGWRIGRLVVLKRGRTRITPGGQKKVYWLCQCDCGKQKEIYGYHLHYGKTRSCGCIVREGYGENKDLIGGYTNKKSGYVYVRVNGKVTLKHRIIMEREIGRPLTRSELVHHLNGIRNDNRIENLGIVSSGNHAHSTLIRLLQRRIRLLEAKLGQQKLVESTYPVKIKEV